MGILTAARFMKSGHPFQPPRRDGGATTRSFNRVQSLGFLKNCDGDRHIPSPCP